MQIRSDETTERGAAPAAEAGREGGACLLKGPRPAAVTDGSGGKRVSAPPREPFIEGESSRGNGDGGCGRSYTIGPVRAEPDTRGLATVLLLGYSDLRLAGLAESRSPCPNAIAIKYKLCTRSTLSDHAAFGPASCLTLTGDGRDPPVSMGEALPAHRKQG